jgi:mannosyltransferase OCH1-like enzyme
MINKRIYTIWLSDTLALPPMVELCLSSHKIPGYEHELITLNNCYRNKYVQDAIDAKQWGKACDYLRCYYLFMDGGIYLDSDVYVFAGKNFDQLLDCNMFAGKENNGFINTAVMGSTQHNDILLNHLKEVEEKFKGDDGLYFESSIELITPRLYLEKLKGTIRLLEPEVFYPYDHERNTVVIKPDTICVHFFSKTWK